MKWTTAIIAALGTSLLSGAALAQTVGVGTGPQGTLTNVMGAAIAKAASDASDLKTRAVPHTSNDLHLPLVNKGSVTFGLANAQQIHAAATGTEQYKGRKLDNLRLVTLILKFPVGLVVQKDSDIQKISDLKGKRVPTGYKAQPTVIAQLDAMLANGGLTVADIKPVPVPNTTRGNEDFMQGRADTAMGSLGGARIRQVDAKVGGIRVLPFDDSPAAVARMQKAFPSGYLLELKPGPGTLGVSKPIKTMAFDFVLVTSKDTPDDVVYKVVKAMHGGKKSMVGVSKAFGNFQPSEMAKQYAGQTFHPGAVKFYKEAGIWPGK